MFSRHGTSWQAYLFSLPLEMHQKYLLLVMRAAAVMLVRRFWAVCSGAGSSNMDHNMYVCMHICKYLSKYTCVHATFTKRQGRTWYMHWLIKWYVTHHKLTQTQFANILANGIHTVGSNRFVMLGSEVIISHQAFRQGLSSLWFGEYISAKKVDPKTTIF